MKMKSKSTQSPASKARVEFKGKPGNVSKAMKMDRASDRAIAKKTGTKVKGY